METEKPLKPHFVAAYIALMGQGWRPAMEAMLMMKLWFGLPAMDGASPRVSRSGVCRFSWSILSHSSAFPAASVQIVTFPKPDMRS